MKASKNYALEPMHYILFGITLYILIAVLTGCSTTNNGVIKSKQCYNAKWHSQ